MATDDGPDQAALRSAAFGGGSMSGMQSYEDTLVSPVFEPWATYLLDRLNLAGGERLLDVATGPGTVARLASGRLGPAGYVLAADVSEAMLSIASAKPLVPRGPRSTTA